QVPLDGAWAEEELRADLGIRQPVPGEPGDLLLLRRELVPRVVAAPAHLLASRKKLVPGPLRESLGSHRHECLVCVPELLAGVRTAVLTAQPFAVEQLGPGEVRAEAGSPKAVDCLAIEGFGNLTVRQQGG